MIPTSVVTLVTSPYELTVVLLAAWLAVVVWMTCPSAFTPAYRPPRVRTVAEVLAAQPAWSVPAEPTPARPPAAPPVLVVDDWPWPGPAWPT